MTPKQILSLVTPITVQITLVTAITVPITGTWQTSLINSTDGGVYVYR